MYTYDTVVEAVNGLRSRGYEQDFNIAFDKLICLQNNFCLNPSEFEITEIHRFEGDSNPSDEDVVYAIESKDNSMKGVLTAAFGTYADIISSDMIRKLAIHKQ